MKHDTLMSSKPGSAITAIRLSLVRCGVLGILFWSASLPVSLLAQNGLVELSRAGCGRATAYSKTNKIVTVGNLTHVAWLDSDRTGFVVRIRTRDNRNGQWSPTYDIGKAVDNHGGPALAVDSKNYLHVVYGPHHHPMSYRRSLLPNDSSAWSEEVKFGDRLTYPSLMVARDDTLIMVCRKSHASQPWSVVAHFKPPGEKWSEASTLIQAAEGGYSQFHVSLAWGPGQRTLHLATRMYGDTPRWGYLVGYIRSSDNGRTWTSSKGKAIALPATRKTIEPLYRTPPAQRKIHESGSAVAGGLVAVDRNDRPHVLFHTLRPDGSLPHQAWIATPSEETDGWSRMGINKKIDVCPATASLSTPGGFAIAADGSWHLALTMTDPPGAPGSPFGTRLNEVVWACSTDAGKSFESKLISPANDQVPNWLPNIERSTGFNQAENPAVIFTSGPKGAKLNDILQNRVYWFRAPAPPKE